MGRAGRRALWLAVVATLVAGCTSTDPGVTAGDVTRIVASDDASVPSDPDVRIVTLSNGFTVYLRANDRPGGSAEMRLAINAGSGQEDPDQSGTAHFLEHMLFNGTTEVSRQRTDRHASGLRNGVRCRRQRVHLVRRDGLRAHRADDRRRQPGYRARRAARVAVGGHARAGSGRQGEGRRLGRMAPTRSVVRRPGRQGQRGDVPDRLRVRRSSTDRHRHGDQRDDARAAAPLLRHLVSPRQCRDHGGRRHRRRRHGSRRSATASSR